MPSLYENLMDRARKRSKYRRTLAELKQVGPETRRDLGIDDLRIREIATNAVYGR